MTEPLAPPPWTGLRRRAWQVGVGLVVGLVALALALRGVDLGALIQAVSAAHPGWVGLVLASVGLNTLAKAARWRVLLGPQAPRTTFGRLLRTLLAGQMLNALLPARTGDLARVWMLGRPVAQHQPPDRAFVLGSVALEKAVDLLAYALCTALLAVFVPLQPWLRRPAGALGLGALLCLGALFGLLAWQGPLRRLLERLQPRWRAPIESALDSLDVLRQAGAVGWLWGWTVVVWVTAVLNNYLLLFAFDLRLPPVAALLVLVAVQASVSVPSLPAGLGVFEYLCVLSLALFAVDRLVALGYGFTLHLLVLGPSTLLGGLFLWREVASPQPGGQRG